MKTFKDFLRENKEIEDFSSEQINRLRREYGSLTKIDPASSAYKKLTKLLDNLPPKLLKQLVQSNIKFVSMLAKNRLKEGYTPPIKPRTGPGYDFRTALVKVKPDEKIIFGTRTNKFHIIDRSDRDFNTSFAFTKVDAQRVGENGVKNPGGFLLN